MGVRSVVLGLALLFLAAASAQGDALVFVQRDDVWVSRPDGSRQLRITRDGTRRAPYVSPTISDTGVILALRGVFLHSFRANGQRIIPPRRWAVPPTPSLSTEPLSVDVSTDGRNVATENALYSTFFDPGTQRVRPSLTARFVDFFDWRRNRELGVTDTFYDYATPAWIDSRSVLTTSYGIFNAQVLRVDVGHRTRGAEFYRDPGRDPLTGTNSHWLLDAELTRAGDRFAVTRRAIQAGDADDASPGTIQIYRTRSPSTASTPLCAIGPGRSITREADPSWSPDGRTLFWWERGQGLYRSTVTSAAGCGLRPRLIVRGAIQPDASRARLVRRGRRG